MRLVDRKTNSGKSIHKKEVLLQKKEFVYLSNISKIASSSSRLSIVEIIKKTLFFIQQSFKNHKFVCARFVLNNLELRTKNFKITRCKLSQAISIKNKNDAKIEVFYSKQRRSREKCYSKQEVFLIKLTAQIIEGLIKHKLTEEELKKKDEKYQFILENSVDGVALARIDTKQIVYSNSELEKLLGYSKKELKNLSISKIHPKKELSYIYGQFRKQAAGKIVLLANAPVLKKDGKIIYCDIRARPIVENGEKYLLGFFRDITQEKSNIKKLEESQNLLVHQLHFEETINEIVKRLVMVFPENINNGICDALSVLRNFLQVERCCLYLFNDDGLSARCAYQSNAIWLKPVKEKLLSSTMPDLFNQIRNGENLYIHDINKMAEGFKLERRAWKKNGVKSLLFVSITHEDNSVGFLGFESIKDKKDWIESDLVALLTFGKMISYALLEKEFYFERESHISRMENVIIRMVGVLSLVVEKRDPYTAGHQKRVAILSSAIAKELGLSEIQIKGIYFGALIHDIGKIHIPSEILSYPGKLTDEEFSLIKAHPQVGFDIVKNIKFSWPVGEIILNHHERLNGSGYPNGLVAKKLTIECRIVAVADVVEAMISHRPYRSALGLDKALSEISINKNKLYDADVVDACVRLFKKEKFAFKDSHDFM